MVRICANKFCANPSHEYGRLFRLDIDIGDKSGGTEHKTEYVFLCDACAQKMRPVVEVVGDAIRVRLARNSPKEITNIDVWSRRAN